jgi:hypothetical protein
MKTRIFMSSPAIFRTNDGMIIRVFLFSIFIILINLSAISQSIQQNPPDTAIPALSGEKISLFTDRNIYCVNEKIYFTAEYSCIDELDKHSWSNVLYVELIRWNGNELAQMKLKLTRPGVSGSMQIPGNILSGNYYLRAYTKWMRNYSAYDYAYLPVKIVNPFRPETDEGPAEKQAAAGAATLNPERKILINGVSCAMNNNEYRPREKAEVELSLNDRKLSGFDRYCLSVVKAGAIDTTFYSYEPGSTSPDSSLSYIEYLPEIRGITISGEIIDKSAELPLKDVFVSLSETRNGEYFSVYQTDDRGRFVFLLPDMHGQHDFFIQTGFKDSIPSEIKIDDGFYNKPVKLPYVAFILNKDEIDLVKEMVINQQLSERYLPKIDTIAVSQPAKAEPLVFYGNKKIVYYTDKYIELPNVEEFIYEIVLEANIINEKGNASFITMKREDFERHLPLILMDNVQIDNDDRLLNTPLTRIERVEVVNMNYIIGIKKYDGIISFYSRNKDFAGVELKENSMFFTYGLFSDIDHGNDFSKDISDSRIPDRRNLLYWNPDITLSADKKTTISFFTSDIKGEYIVYIRGKNSREGREIFGRCYFSVN